MPGKHLFEYAVIRVVPRVHREEFVNVGVIVFCKAERFLKCTYQLNREKLKIFDPTLDVDGVETHLQSFEWICAGGVKGRPIAAFDLPLRFRWLTATRSTVVQTSKIHPGFSNDLSATLHQLFSTLVL